MVSTQCYCQYEMFAPCCNIPREVLPDEQDGIIVAETYFDSILHLSNRIAQNVTGDGNCYFRCLSRHFLGTEDFHVPIRETIVNFMITHMDVFSRDIHQSNRRLTVNEYIHNMLLTNGSLSSWATDIEIEATATLLQIPIYVLGRWGHNIAWQKFRPRFPLEKPFRCSYITLLNTGDHYMLARSSLALCNCLCVPPVQQQYRVHVADECKPSSSKYAKFECQQPNLKANSDQGLTQSPRNSGTSMSEPKSKHCSQDNIGVDNSCKNDINEHLTQSHSNSDPKSCQQPNTSFNGCLKNKMNKSLKSDTVEKAGQIFLQHIEQGPDKICFSCQKLFYATSVSSKAVSPAWIEILRGILSEDTDTILLCSRCLTSLKKNKMPPLCVLNNLFVQTAPPQLLELNVAEQKLISLAHAYMKMVILPYGQRAINGQVINFPYDVEEQVTQFSHKGLVIVRVAGQKIVDIPKEYKVNTEKVIDALNWLKLNNNLYKHISIPEFPSNICVPPTIEIDCPVKENEGDVKTGKNDGWIPEVSVVGTDPVMPKVDFSQYVNNEHVPIHNIPRLETPPINMFTDLYLEQMAFPTLFPDGVNGLRTPRKLKTTVLQYFQSRLLSSDLRWQKNLSYLFWATNLTEKQKLSEGVSIATRIRKSKGKGKMEPLTLGKVRSDLKHNPDYPEHFYGFMKGVRGSAAYWNSAKLDLLSMINSKGPMTWFLTLSANDMNWDDLMCVLCKVNGMPHSDNDIRQLTKKEKTLLMIHNPVLTARHFSRRIHYLIHSFILSEAQPLGKIVDYFWRIEFQLRGSPHLHSVWWVENAPNLDTDEGLKAAPAFIDKYVSANIPDSDDIMKKRVEVLQRHNHTNTCKKYQKNGQVHSCACRFGFPQPISSVTHMKSKAEFSTSAHSYVLHRLPGSEYINPYNKDILRVWNANMDIQLVGSAQGAANYVCSYICKEESDEVHKAIHEAVSKLPCNVSSRQHFSVIGNIFLTHRLLSTQEAAFKMVGLPLRGASRKTVYVNTRPPDERSRLLRPKQEMENLEDDSEDIFCSNLFDRYSKRPSNEEFDGMTLAQFGAWFDSCKESKNSVELLDGAGFVRRRQQEQFLRVPRLTVEQNGDQYYYQLLLLHLPWRKEEELTHSFDSAEHAFQHKQHLLQKPPTNQQAEEIARAIKQIQSLEDKVMHNYIAPVVAPNTEAYDNDLPDSSEVIQDDPDNFNLFEINSQFDKDIEIEDIKDVNTVISGIDEDVHLNHLKLTRMTDSDYEKAIHGLNAEQYDVFSTVQRYFNELHKFNLGEHVKPQSLHLYVSGPGGTGKSHVINLLRELITRSSLDSLSNDSPAVVVTAPTGVAAYNIDGLTIHRALNLPVQHGKESKYNPLRGEKLAQMRKQWRSTTTIIIDEISMVSHDTLLHIHRRLNEIKDVDEGVVFGNLNVIALGDFFQLPPVPPGKFVFESKSNVTNLWKNLFSVKELTQNMRQKEDTVFSESLLRVRVAGQTDEDIALLQSRVTNFTYPIDCRKAPFDTALYIFPKVEQCDKYNSYKLQEVAKHSVLHTINAEHSLVEIKKKRPVISEKEVPEKFIPVDDRDCAGLPRKLQVCVGAVVMLRRNINTYEGLVNGARGVVTGFVWKNGIPPKQNESIVPEAILVKFFNSGMTDPVPIKPVVAEFYGKYGSLLLRKQFPLILSWAATIHKVQGLTLQHVVIDIGPEIFTPGMSYVALSRVKNLQGLAILNFDKSKITCSENVVAEMDRLRKHGCAESVHREECKLSRIIRKPTSKSGFVFDFIVYVPINSYCHAVTLHKLFDEFNLRSLIYIQIISDQWFN